jgi:UDP-4-amino-4,6-dideoxy-N-acetyl-beta-L-altrosamine transaminase
VAIPYGRQTIDAQDVQAVVDVLHGDWLTQGPAVAEFEAAVAETCEVPYAVAFSSGTAALHGAMAAAGLGPGDDVVTSAITFAASANAAAYVGATPRFADIDADTWNMGAETLARALTAATRAVVPVDFTGLAAPLAAIREQVGPEVTIIQDAAHALGARTTDGPVGSCAHADMAIFSFHPVKAIATGEGGMVTTRDPRLRERLVRFRTHGIARDAEASAREGGWYAGQSELGFNYRLSDLHAALGRSQLRKLEGFIAARNRIAERYCEALEGTPGVRLPPAARAGARHAHHLFVVHLEGGAVRRRAYEEMHRRGILVQVHYLPVYRHPWYRETYGYDPAGFPNAERYYAGCLSLPCFPALTTGQQDDVVAALLEAIAS